MTNKRFKKLLMSYGRSRNVADFYVTKMKPWRNPMNGPLMPMQKSDLLHALYVMREDRKNGEIIKFSDAECEKCHEFVLEKIERNKIEINFPNAEEMCIGCPQRECKYYTKWTLGGYDK